MAHAQQTADPDAPKLPIPTAFAWLLLESTFHGSPLANLARFAAVGAAKAGENEARAIERYRGYLDDQKTVNNPRQGVRAVFMAAFARGLRSEIWKVFGKDVAGAKRMYRHLRASVGPFSVLVTDHVVAIPTVEQRALLSFSERLDRRGTAFASACESHNLEEAKAVMLVADDMDKSYWALPEEGLPDADVNRERLRGANNWDQLKRACVPWVFNTTLSWLSLLDMATLSAGRYPGADFSLFQPLITKPEKGADHAPVMEADRERLPVANLIRLLKAIRDDINARLQKRPNPPERKLVNKGDSTKLANGLKPFKKNALLSGPQFTSLLGLESLKPDAPPVDDERCGFDATSLHLATNLFSLLTPRDGLLPTRKTQKKASTRIACLTAVEPVYMRWWTTHREVLAEGAISPPRPPWLTALRTE